KIVAPGCNLPEAAAGPAGVLLDHYEPIETDLVTSVLCYDGGLIEARATLEESTVDFFVVGATDPFRNSRISEARNGALAQPLLTRVGPLIWFDVHKAEPDPPIDTRITLPRYTRGDQDRGGGGSGGILDAFPPLLWVALVGLLGLGGLVAVAAARRLGPPVAE